jgi:hypothetical protein
MGSFGKLSGESRSDEEHKDVKWVRLVKSNSTCSGGLRPASSPCH